MSRREDLERAVLAAAEQWYSQGRAGHSSPIDSMRLTKAIGELIFECPECNAGGHTCPGCGASVAHYGPRACEQCMADADGQPTGPVPWSRPDACPKCGGPCEDECLFVCDNCAPLRAGASVDRVDGTDLTEPCADCGAVELAADEPVWTPRTMTDVRRGDRIRPTPADGTEPDPAQEIDVVDRYWPPQPRTESGLPADRGVWHVTAGKWHGEDHVVQPGECCVVLGTDPRPRFFDPAMKVDIRVTPSEVAAIEAFGGWANRRETLTSE